MTWVYRVEVLGTTRYIGHTDDIERREKQHNYLCFRLGKDKKLYRQIKKTDVKKIQLIPIKTFGTKIEAKRWEAFLILNDYFGRRELWQSIPRITDI